MTIGPKMPAKAANSDSAQLLTGTALSAKARALSGVRKAARASYSSSCVLRLMSVRPKTISFLVIISPLGGILPMKYIFVSRI